jgi:hypothetical protein
MEAGTSPCRTSTRNRRRAWRPSRSSSRTRRRLAGTPLKSASSRRTQHWTRHPRGPRAQPAGKLETRGLLPGNQGHPQRESPPVARAVRAALGLRPRRRDVTVDSARIPVQLGARLRLDCRDCLAPLFSGRTIGVAAGRPDGVLTPSGRRLRFWHARQSAPRKSHRGRCCCCTRTSATSLPTTHLPPCSALS